MATWPASSSAGGGGRVAELARRDSPPTVSALPFLVDGLLLGATLALGAVGLTLTYSILGFANFTHGDLITWGAYFALSLTLMWTAATGQGLGQLGALSFGWPFLVIVALAMLLTGAVGLLLDWVLFRPLRRHGTQIVLVIASFGASLALRYGLAFIYGPEPAYYTREIQLAAPVVAGLPLRATPDQLFVLGLTAVLVVLLHLLLTRTTLGRAMRAVSENPALARVVGVDPEAVARWTWLLGGALAAVAGIFVGLTVQIRPWLGFDLLLPLFAATILGGVGSVYGAVLGGLLIGLAEALAVPLVGAEYRAAVAFTVLLAVLLVRPRGLLGTRE
jgi:branched-chain amino acid transport system permease protein